jgi:hypothetical protein
MSKKDFIEGGTEYKQSEEKVYKQSGERKYAIMFRQNRSFELHVGRQTLFFGPYGIQDVGEDVIKHPDFIQQQQYFSIKPL